ncbi:Scr1 family TA system antitoxin-like transcriptional regulator [Actinophytocola sp.]|uniref:Scr1 family TA system antitoxin-like transcriptional regulator n=1 Tax=Actinophytocola sp. TaxID=1872138 RepID=UPI00345C2C4C
MGGGGHRGAGAGRRRGGAVAIDHLAGTFCVEDQAVVDRYNLAFEHLRATALSARDSLAWVRRVAERM